MSKFSKNKYETPITQNFDTNENNYFNFPIAPLRLCGKKTNR